MFATGQVASDACAPVEGACAGGAAASARAWIWAGAAGREVAL